MKTPTDEERKKLLSERKKERERKKVWINEAINEVVSEAIKKGKGNWWSFL